MLKWMERVQSTLARQTDHPSIPLELTDESFDEFVNRYPLAVVDFWADWCHPCRAIEPIIKALAKDYSGKVVFGKLNVDENERTAARFGIMSIPALLIFKEGRVVDRLVGPVPRHAIESKIKNHMEP